MWRTFRAEAAGANGNSTGAKKQKKSLTEVVEGRTFRLKQTMLPWKLNT
nr:hypothetical protein [Comamonas jiangduensis]